MKRTIKFRAKTTANGHWVYGSLVARGGNCYSILNSKSEPWVDPSSVCQFTGLLDCDGREIYDGDILDTKFGKYATNGYSYICKWIDSGFALFYQGRSNGVKEKNNWLNRYPLTKRNVDDLIIIGNIFDNPELVKQDPNEIKD